MEQSKVLNRLALSIGAFQAHSETMPIQVARTFVLVALHEGCSVIDLCKLTGVSQSTMSRHLMDLGERDRRKEPGLKLVMYRQDPMELRKNQYFLTAKGKALLAQLVQIWDR